MGHYDNCRPGYCGKCGAAPGNIVKGVCQICHPAPKPMKVAGAADKLDFEAVQGARAYQLHLQSGRKMDMPTARAAVDSAQFTDRDVNLLNSLANWLETRAGFHSFKMHAELMTGYATKLLDIRDRIEPVAVAKPVTMDELFGKTKTERQHPNIDCPDFPGECECQPKCK